MLKNLRTRIAILLLVVGPGIITANVDNDAGGITTYSVAGAHFGYATLWSLLPIAVALILVQEMCNRLGVVTGKGLSDLIREHFGVKVTFYLMVAVVATNFGNILAEFAGVSASSQVFGLTPYIAVPAAAAIVWLLAIKGTYRSIEKVFLTACLFYVCYIITGFLAHPDWHQVRSALLPSSVSPGRGYLVMLVGIVGTTIAPWMQFYQQASVAEKGIKIEEYRYSRLDTIVGGIVVTVVAFFIILACGATMFPQHIHVESAGQAAIALKPLAGKYASYLFAFGLLNASLFAASILPLSTAYSVCEGMGWETGMDHPFVEAPQFYGLYSLLILFGFIPILIPGISLVKVMLISQVVNGVLLPFVLVFILLLINKRDIMGDFANSKVFNALAWLTTAVLIVLDLVFLASLFGGTM